MEILAVVVGVAIRVATAYLKDKLQRGDDEDYRYIESEELLPDDESPE